MELENGLYFLREINMVSIVLRIVVAMLCGGMIGLERGRANQAAGMRTYMIVSLGAAVVMVTGQWMFEEFQTGDPARLGAQVISGIGFLGAGSIIISGKTRIRGLTTAAGLWVSACIGLSIGSGFIEVGLVATLAVFITLTVLKKVENMVDDKACIYMEADPEMELSEFSEQIRTKELEVILVNMSQKGTTHQKMILSIKNPKRYTHKELLEIIRNVDGVKYVEYVS